MKEKFISLILLLLVVNIFPVFCQPVSSISPESVTEVINSLLHTHGESHAFRIKEGVKRTAAFWRKRDGSPDVFKAFCKKHFIADPVLLEETLKRLETNFEAIRGNFYRIKHTFLGPLELPSVKKLPVDSLFSSYLPDAHMQEDLFRTKAAFAVLLNFPHYSLEEKERLGAGWTRLQWAMANAGDLFTSRVPPKVNQQLGAFAAEIDQYVGTYNLYPGNLLARDNKPLFTDKEKQIFHWGPRDMIQEAYHTSNAEKKQELIYRAMLRVIDQTVPAAVIDNPDVLWNPYSNKVYKKETGKPNSLPVPLVSSPEGGKRYEFILRNQRTQARLDPYYPGNATEMDRQFRLQRRMSEESVERLLIQLLTSPQATKVGRWIEKKLKRKLRPYDLFYDGFSAGAQRSMAEFDKQLARKYPDVETFSKDMPNILQQIGFPKDIAEAVNRKIVIQQTDSIPHGGWREMRDDKSYVRLGIPPGGMDYKTFQLGLHEYGHDMQLTLSLDYTDYYFLKDLPADSFSESFAMMLGACANDLLGIEKDQDAHNMSVLLAFWRAYTSGGPSLVEMRMWNWLYDHPRATPAQFQEAAIGIAKEVWNKYFAPVFHEKDVPLLLVYNHLVRGVLYFPEYSIGEVVAYQITEYVKDKNLGAEIIRMCRIGSISPNLWMQQAVGAPISAKPLQQATENVLNSLR